MIKFTAQCIAQPGQPLFGKDNTTQLNTPARLPSPEKLDKGNGFKS